MEKEKDILDSRFYNTAVPLARMSTSCRLRYCGLENKHHVIVLLISWDAGAVLNRFQLAFIYVQSL